MGGPDALRATARALRGEAATIRPSLDGVLRVAAQDVWGGPAADRFADELALQRARVTDVAAELERTAAALDVRADRLEAELRAAEERERRRAASRLATAQARDRGRVVAPREVG